MSASARDRSNLVSSNGVLPFLVLTHTTTKFNMIRAQLRTPLARSSVVSPARSRSCLLIDRALTSFLRTQLSPSRRYASMGGSSNRPIQDGAKELGGDVKRNQTMIAVGGVGLVAAVALWWKSAKTEGTSQSLQRDLKAETKADACHSSDPLKPPVNTKA